MTQESGDIDEKVWRNLPSSKCTAPPQRHRETLFAERKIVVDPFEGMESSLDDASERLKRLVGHAIADLSAADCSASETQSAVIRASIDALERL